MSVTVYFCSLDVITVVLLLFHPLHNDLCESYKTSYRVTSFFYKELCDRICFTCHIWICLRNAWRDIWKLKFKQKRFLSRLRKSLAYFFSKWMSVEKNITLIDCDSTWIFDLDFFSWNSRLTFQSFPFLLLHHLSYYHETKGNQVLHYTLVNMTRTLFVVMFTSILVLFSPSFTIFVPSFFTGILFHASLVPEFLCTLAIDFLAICSRVRKRTLLHESLLQHQEMSSKEY